MNHNFNPNSIELSQLASSDTALSSMNTDNLQESEEYRQCTRYIMNYHKHEKDINLSARKHCCWTNSTGVCGNKTWKSCSGCETNDRAHFYLCGKCYTLHKDIEVAKIMNSANE